MITSFLIADACVPLQLVEFLLLLLFIFGFQFHFAFFPVFWRYYFLLDWLLSLPLSGDVSRVYLWHRGFHFFLGFFLFLIFLVVDKAIQVFIFLVILALDLLVMDAAFSLFPQDSVK